MLHHEKKQITKTQIYRSVASSTAIETGVSVHKIEQQLKQNQAQAKAVGHRPLIWQDVAHQLHHRAVVP